MGGDARAINLTTVKATGLKDNTSEEHILPTSQDLDKLWRKTIHRAVDYEVTFDDADSRGIVR